MKLQLKVALFRQTLGQPDDAQPGSPADARERRWFATVIGRAPLASTLGASSTHQHPPAMTRDIIAAIRDYASAYERFQGFQDAHPDKLPIGDQKTGVIGEFYAMLFARSTYAGCAVAFAAPTAAWDIEVSGAHDLKIQVKAVSAYSKTRIISPIFPGWDHLYLIALDRAFLPTGFWTVTTSDIFGARPALRSQKMRDPAKPSSGSPGIPFGDNRLSELQPLISAGSGRA